MVPLPAFNMFDYVKRLISAGFTAQQAEVQAHLQEEVILSLISEKLATKDELKFELCQVESELKQEILLARRELKIDINRVESELKNEINRVESELKNDINRVEKELKLEIIRLDKDIFRLEAKIDKMDVKFTWKFNHMYWMLGFLLASNMTVLFKIVFVP